MLPGILLGFVLAAPPIPESRVPAGIEAHKDSVARFGAAIWNIRRDRLLSAARQLEEAARSDPSATAPFKELIRIYTLIGREPEAIKIGRKLLQKDARDFDVAHGLARLLFEAGELKDAVAAAKLAIECPTPATRAEKAVGVYRELATLCEKANDLATAELALRKAIELVVDQRKEVVASGALSPVEADTAAAECLERLGKVLTRLKKHDDAAASFQSAARLYADPFKANDPSAAANLDWNLSSVLQSKGDSQAALDHLNRILKHHPSSPEPYLRLAKLLRSLDRREDIIFTLENFLKVDPRNLGLRTVLAAEMARAGDGTGRAEIMFAKVQAETNDPRIMAIIVQSHVDLGNARAIVADLDRAFEKLKDVDKEDKPVDTPETAAARSFAAEKARTLAEILNDDSRAAAAVLTAAATDLRTGVKHAHQTYFFLGKLAARHNKWVTAAFEYKQVVRTAPREARADAFLAWIDVLRVARRPSELVDACRVGLEHPELISSAYCNYYLAQALAELGKANEKEAIAAADKAIQFAAHGERLQLKLQKVHVLTILEKWDEAIALARQLFEEFPAAADRLQIRYRLASTYSSAGKRAESEAELRAILEHDPDHAGACNDLGFSLADQGRNLDEAEQLVRNAIMIERFDRKKTGASELDNAAYIDSLGWVLFRRGKLPEARAELEKAVMLYDGESDPIVWDHLGDVLFRLGEKAKAKIAWDKAIWIYNNDLHGPQRNKDDRFEELKRKIKLVP